MFLMSATRSPFRDSEGYLRVVIGLNEDDIQLVLKQSNSSFVIWIYHLAFLHLKVFQRLFTQWVIMRDLEN